MEGFKVIIFDLDGTLIHSAPDLQFAVNAALAALDREPLDLGTVISFIGDGVEKLVERSLEASGEVTDALRDAAMVRFLETYEQNMTTLTRPYPGVFGCLEDLKAKGAKLGICTNKPAAPTRQICNQLGLTRFFDDISGAEAGQS